MSQEPGEQPIRYDRDPNEMTDYGRQGRQKGQTPTSQKKDGAKIVPPQGGSGTAPPKGQNNEPKK